VVYLTPFSKIFKTLTSNGILEIPIDPREWRNH